VFYRIAKFKKLNLILLDIEHAVLSVDFPTIGIHLRMNLYIRNSYTYSRSNKPLFSMLHLFDLEWYVYIYVYVYVFVYNTCIIRVALISIY
jgi:hypothetical protein